MDEVGKNATKPSPMTSTLVKNIVNIALPQNREKFSHVKLVENSGYSASERKPSIEDLSSYLIEHPEFIELWRMWSDDKRTSPGWYFAQNGNDYIVGFYPDGKQLLFTDPFQACAEFILREVACISDKK